MDESPGEELVGVFGGWIGSLNRWMDGEECLAVLSVDGEVDIYICGGGNFPVPRMPVERAEVWMPRMPVECAEVGLRAVRCSRRGSAWRGVLLRGGILW